LNVIIRGWFFFTIKFSTSVSQSFEKEKEWKGLQLFFLLKTDQKKLFQVCRYDTVMPQSRQAPPADGCGLKEIGLISVKRYRINSLSLYCVIRKKRINMHFKKIVVGTMMVAIVMTAVPALARTTSVNETAAKTAAAQVKQCKKTALSVYNAALKTARDSYLSALKTAKDNYMNAIASAKATYTSALKAANDAKDTAAKKAAVAAYKTAREAAIKNWQDAKTSARAAWDASKTAAQAAHKSAVAACATSK
jgi:hypothetical protein